MKWERVKDRWDGIHYFAGDMMRSPRPDAGWYYSVQLPGGGWLVAGYHIAKLPGPDKSWLLIRCDTGSVDVYATLREAKAAALTYEALRVARHESGAVKRRRQ
jgi:hypothetical protein